MGPEVTNRINFISQKLYLFEHEHIIDEALKDDLAPLEEQRQILTAQAEKRTNHLTWLGLGLMSVQFGILARLTWWEYSWDIMEPGKL